MNILCEYINHIKTIPLGELPKLPEIVSVVEDTAEIWKIFHHINEYFTQITFTEQYIPIHVW